MRLRLCKLPAISLLFRCDVVAMFTVICLKQVFVRVNFCIFLLFLVENGIRWSTQVRVYVRFWQLVVFVCIKSLQKLIRACSNTGDLVRTRVKQTLKEKYQSLILGTWGSPGWVDVSLTYPLARLKNVFKMRRDKIASDTRITRVTLGTRVTSLSCEQG